MELAGIIPHEEIRQNCFCAGRKDEGYGGVTPLVLKPGNRRMSAVNFTPRLHLFHEETNPAVH
jgi:hypothetical protein